VREARARLSGNQGTSKFKQSREQQWRPGDSNHGAVYR
jgi:hypothetical protein